MKIANYKTVTFYFTHMGNREQAELVSVSNGWQQEHFKRTEGVRINFTLIERQHASQFLDDDVCMPK